MKKSDPVEQALDRLSAIKHVPGTSSAATQEIRTFLKNRTNLVVAKAAKIAGEAHTMELMPDLTTAFHRLMGNPQKLDKGCAATTEIISALYELDYIEPDIYLLGIHHVQMEGSFGPPVDAAARLRAVSALSLARTRYPYALDEIVTLLVDEWPQARIGAVRALSSNGGQAGALLLKLRILTGETEPDVLAECFAGLLAIAPEQSLPLIATYIDSKDLAIGEAALLALGSSRLPEALDLLKARWGQPAGGSLRKVMLIAMAMIRSEAAIEFLVSLLAESSLTSARDVITALAIFRDNEKVRKQVEAAVSRRNVDSLSEAFRREF